MIVFFIYLCVNDNIDVFISNYLYSCEEMVGVVKGKTGSYLVGILNCSHIGKRPASP